MDDHPRELLDLDKCQTCVGWTYEEPYEFAIKNPDELAALWGSVKENPTMTYAKLARGLRYYYGKNIIEKVPYKPYTYRFVFSEKTEDHLSRFSFLRGGKKSAPDETKFEDTSSSQASACTSSTYSS